MARMIDACCEAKFILDYQSRDLPVPGVEVVAAVVVIVVVVVEIVVRVVGDKQALEPMLLELSTFSANKMFSL